MVPASFPGKRGRLASVARGLQLCGVLFGGVAVGQDGLPAPAMEAAQSRVTRWLRELDLPYTDWTVLRDVRDKVTAAGPAAQPAVAVEIELARDNADPRYRLRLLGVQLGVDASAAFAQLATFVVGKDESAATLAARVLGRCAPPADRLAELVRERLATENRLAVRGALILAAGDAGSTAVAELLRVMLEKGGFGGDEVLWAWTALAQCADAGLAEQSRAWLVPQSPLVGAAVLLMRRFKDAQGERPLLRLLEAETRPLPVHWVAQSLGAIGTDTGRQALRAALAAEAAADGPGEVQLRRDLDPRRLALLRLQDKAARTWAEDAIARAASLPSARSERLPELFGRWHLPGAAADLERWAAATEAPFAVRASAARGLCWLGERRGLYAAASLLGDPDADAHVPAILESLRLLQRTLHDFVDDPARPECRGLVPGDRAKAAAVGKEWRLWLEGIGDRLRWRTPPEDAEDLLFWY